VALALCFARSIAPTASVMRFSILPLIDSILRLAFASGVEPFNDREALSTAHECEIRRSAISLDRFTATKYFEAEVLLPNTSVRKA
jgi:hypothetical protein